MGVDRQHGCGGHQQGVAIGLGVLDGIHRNAPPRAGAVFHDHRHAQIGGHILRQQTRHKVGRTAGRKAHHDFDGLAFGQCQTG